MTRSPGHTLLSRDAKTTKFSCDGKNSRIGFDRRQVELEIQSLDWRGAMCGRDGVVAPRSPI